MNKITNKGDLFPLFLFNKSYNMELKKCSKCGEYKTLDNFCKSKKSKDGLNYSCKECNHQRAKVYYKENYEKLLKKTRDYCKKNPEWVYNRYKKYRLENKEKINERMRLYFANNKDKKKQYRENDKARRNEQRKERTMSDPLYKMTERVRIRLHKYLKKLNITKNNKTFDIVGCTPEELKTHLENQFVNGMTWENHGNLGWHIDHIIPLASATNEEELYKLCHYTNLQPLWWLDNVRKGSKIL